MDFRSLTIGRLAQIAASLPLIAALASAQMGVPAQQPQNPQQQQQAPPPPLPPQTAAALSGPAGSTGVIPLSLQGASLTQVVDLLDGELAWRQHDGGIHVLAVTLFSM